MNNKYNYKQRLIHGINHQRQHIPKLKAALSPGAYGHGVPSVQNLSTIEILIAFEIPGAGWIIVFMTVRALLKYMNTEKMGRVSPLKEIM